MNLAFGVVLQQTTFIWGTTLSDHKPAVGAAVEAAFAQFYAGVAVASVKLPTQPAAEISMSGGMRQKIGDIDIDFGVTYFLYPGEMSTSPNTDYWQAAIRADKRISELLRVAGGFAYSPNVSNTGAWSWYAAGGVGIDVPSRLLPADIGVLFTGARDTPGLAISPKNSAVFRCLPYRTGRPA